MKEKTKRTGRKVLLFFSIYFLGVASVPPGWSFWGLLKEISQNPDIMEKILFVIAGVLVICAAWHVKKELNDKEQ